MEAEQSMWMLLHAAALVFGSGLVACALAYGLTTVRRAPQPPPSHDWQAFLTWGFYLLSTGLLVAVGTRSITFLPPVLFAHVVAALFVLLYLLAYARWALALGIGWGCIYFGGMFPAPVIRQTADVAALGFFGVFLVLLCWLTMRETPPASLPSRSTPEAGS
jgi:hypothetical protein